MTNLIINNFSSGYKTNNLDKNSIADGKNIELLPTAYGYGLFRSQGNTSVAQITGEKILGGFDYVQQNSHRHLIFAKTETESKVYLNNGITTTLIKDGMSPNAKNFNAVCFNNGAFITNDIGETFFYEYGVGITNIDATDDQNRQIIGTALAVFDERIYMNSGSRLHYCGLGDPTDWSSSEVATTRAGYFDNFKNSSAVITGLKVFNGSLIINRSDNTVELTGSLADDSYNMKVVSNAGCVNPFALTNIDLSYLTFFIYGANGIGFYYLSFNELGVIKPQDEISSPVHEVLRDIDESRLDEIYTLTNTKKKQVWCHIPNKKYPNNTFWLIYDLAGKFFLPPRITQKITSAWLYNGEIHAGTSDGKVLKEDSGNSFDGTDISFFAKTMEFNFGSFAVKKEFPESPVIQLDQQRNNTFKIRYITDGNSKDFTEHEISANNYIDLVFAENEDDPNVFSVLAEDEDDPNGFCFADENPSINTISKPSKMKSLTVMFLGDSGDLGLNHFEIPLVQEA